MSGLMSKVASVRRRAVDRMAANPALFGDLDHSPFALLTPARRGRGPNRSAAGVDEARLARERLRRAAAAELAFEGERERALADAREREAAAERERERGESHGRAPQAGAAAHREHTSRVPIGAFDPRIEIRSGVSRPAAIPARADRHAPVNRRVPGRPQMAELVLSACCVRPRRRLVCPDLRFRPIGQAHGASLDARTPRIKPLSQLWLVE
jgi:hypothetical protein